MFAASKSGKYTPAAPSSTDTYFPYVSFLSETTATNGQQNNTFLDSGTANGGVGFTITRNGTPTQGSVTPYWPDGYWGNYFNGSTDYLSAPSNAAFALGTGDFTIECWIYLLTVPTGYPDIAFIGTYGLSLNGIFLNFRASGTIAITDATTVYATSATALVANTWYHIAAVRSSGSSKIYVNGVGGTAVSFGTNIVQNGFYIGSSGNAGALGFVNGYISNYRLVKGTPVYTGNFTPSTAPLTATQSANINGNPSAAITGTATSLLTCQSNRFVDKSAQVTPATITANGTPRVQAFQPFSPAASYTTALYGGSGYFNGSGDYLSLADNAALQLSTGDFTIEGWFYISGATSTAYNLISKGTASTGWSLNTTSGARIQFSYTASNLTGATTTLVQGAWYHIAVVRSGNSAGNLKIYLNGVQEIASAGAVTDDFSQTSTMYVSASRTATLPLNGYSSNVRVVKGTAVYTGAFTPPTLAPITTAGSTSAASYPSTTNVNTSFAASATSLLTNFTNAGIYDAAVQNHLVTLGNAQTSTTQFKWSPTSLRIDGTAGTCVTIYDFYGGPTDLATTYVQAWTIECWVYYTAGGKVITRGGNPGSTSPSYDFSVSGGTGTFTLASASGTTSSPGYTITYPASTIPTSTWVYWAATRTQAGIVATWVNGIYQGSSGTSVSVYNINNPYLGLGATSPFYGVGSILTGYIQDVRITKGVARYSGTGNFSPPTAAFQTR